MRRLTPAAVAIAALALPTSAVAASFRGVVLSVDRSHHTIQVVDSRHRVHAYRFRGRLPSMHTGSAIAFQASGAAISHVKVTSNRSRTVSYYARVVHSSASGVVLRLADGKTVTFSTHQVKHKRLKKSQRHKRHGKRNAHRADVTITNGGVTINITGLQAGVTVLVTETVDASGNVTITITLPTSADPGEQSASGVISQVDTDSFVLRTGDGSDLRLHTANDRLANLDACDTAEVTYHQDAGMLIADTVKVTGTSTSGDCAGDQTPQDVVGTITSVSTDGVTVSTDEGPMTFTVDDPSITDGYAVGDQVDVTYVQNDDRSLDAIDVEYVEQETTGTVTSVSDGSMTITDDSGNSQTYVADPSDGMFDGVALGDYVDVTYHTAAGHQVADIVDDLSTDWGNY